MKKVLTYTLLGMLGLVLYISNPTKKDFIEYGVSYIKDNYPDLGLQQSSQISGIERIISGVTNVLLADLITDLTTSENYILFSIFEIDLKLARDFGYEVKNIKAIGIAGRFFITTESKR